MIVCSLQRLGAYMILLPLFLYTGSGTAGSTKIAAEATGFCAR
jgi:hypothetical protein